jgi:hypothetical protein
MTNGSVKKSDSARSTRIRIDTEHSPRGRARNAPFGPAAAMLSDAIS